jgi:hypothetical protein
LCFSLELVHAWTKFKLYNVWDILSSCGFSNHFWWFDILKHMIFLFCKFLMFYASFFAHGFVLFFILCFGLGFLLVVSELYFKSPKTNLVLCYVTINFNFVLNIRFIYVLHENLVWQVVVLGVFLLKKYFLYSCSVQMRVPTRGWLLVSLTQWNWWFLVIFYCWFLALVGDLNLNGAFVYPKTWKRKLKKLLLKVAPNG